MSPADQAHLEAQATYAAVIAVAVILGLLLTAYAIAEHYRGRRRKARQQAARQAHTAQQLHAGTTAGWHDPSPADRRRDR